MNLPLSSVTLAPRSIEGFYMSERTLIPQKVECLPSSPTQGADPDPSCLLLRTSSFVLLGKFYNKS